jgi:hypothetical protein
MNTEMNYNVTRVCGTVFRFRSKGAKEAFGRSLTKVSRELYFKGQFEEDEPKAPEVVEPVQKEMNSTGGPEDGPFFSLMGPGTFLIASLFYWVAQATSGVVSVTAGFICAHYACGWVGWTIHTEDTRYPGLLKASRCLLCGFLLWWVLDGGLSEVLEHMGGGNEYPCTPQPRGGCDEEEGP